MADHHEGAQEQAHATVLSYTVIALALFLITVVEVAILYEPLSFVWPTFRIGLLVGLSIVKFVMVVAFFMHLFYDAPLCTFLFSIGMVLAVGTMVALVHLFPADLFPKSALQPQPRDQAAPAEHHAQAPAHFVGRLSQFRRIVEEV